MFLRQDKGAFLSKSNDKQLLSHVDLQHNAEYCGGIFSVDQLPIWQPFGGFGSASCESPHLQRIMSSTAEAVSVHEVDRDGVLLFFVNLRLVITLKQAEWAEPTKVQ